MRRTHRFADGALILVLAGTIGFLATTAATGSGSSVTPAEASEASYRIDPTVVGSDGKVADVRLLAAWTASSFPGEATCEMVLRSVRGSIVGRQKFNFTSLEPSADLLTSVAVDGEAAEATVVCSAAYRPEALEYGVSGVEMVETTRGIEVSGIVHWPSAEWPGTQECVASLGDSAATFTLDVPDGYRFSVPAPGLDESATAVAVSCHSFD